MPYDFRTKRRVEFSETDLAGIVHFSNFFRYMEWAEHGFLRSLGLSVHGEVDGRIVSFARVKAECSYKAPLKFDEEFEIHVLVREKRRKSMSYEFNFYRPDGRLAARGQITAVCVTFEPLRGEIRSIVIPECIASRIEAAPRELLEREHEDGRMTNVSARMSKE